MDYFRLENWDLFIMELNSALDVSMDLGLSGLLFGKLFLFQFLTKQVV